MFYSQTLNFFILLLRLEKVAVAVCACLAPAPEVLIRLTARIELYSTKSTATTTPRYSAADKYDVDLILRLRAM
jgi:hypothetical protein